MKFQSLTMKLLLAAAVCALLSGCLTRRTVTRGGETVESKYVFSSPFQ